MNSAIYNPKTNRIRTVVTSPVGDLPEGYEFVPENNLPGDAVKEPVAAVRVFAAKEFLDRFTGAELVAISEAARTDASLDVMFRKLTAAEAVHSDNPELVQGMDYLVVLGLVSPERRAAILGA